MDNFWLNDLSILFKRNNIFQIIPYNYLSLVNKLNAIFRLSIYFSIILFIFKKDYKYLMIIIIVGILTIIIYKNNKSLNIENNNINDNINNNNNNDSSIQINSNSNINSQIDSNNSDADGCILPTQENPFMNPTLKDYEEGNLMKSCKSYDNSVIRSMENEYFDYGLYRDQTDIFNNNNSQREFYTVPINSILSDTIKFAEWCYKTPPTCAEGNSIQCAADIVNSSLNTRGGPGTSSS
jgi:hypothetical protein